jgi:hypothetical protein
MDTKESRYVTIARIAYHLAKEVLTPYSHPKSPQRFRLCPYTLPQPTAFRLCLYVLLAFPLRLSYRDVKQWLLATDKVCAVLEWKRVPDYSTLSEATKRLLRSKVLVQMRRQLLHKVGVQEEVIVSDSTGYAPRRRSPMDVG